MCVEMCARLYDTTFFLLYSGQGMNCAFSAALGGKYQDTMIDRSGLRCVAGR
jgi:hypothetical protein